MKIKPTKFMSFLGLILSTILSIVGFIYIIPLHNKFGIIWVSGTIIMSIYYAINLFTVKGFSLFRLDNDNKEKKK